jgi:hypothetical protein
MVVTMGKNARVIRNRETEARVADLLELMNAKTASELHRVILLGSSAAHEREPSMPLSYFRNVHDQDGQGAVQTAMLLVTDLRWRVAAGPLIEAIDATGIVSPGELDLLALAFIHADASVFWECPADWFSTFAIEIGEEGIDSEFLEDETEMGDDPRPTLAERVVSPVLRRWAAARAIRHSLLEWPGVFARSKELQGDGGGALMRGLLDSIDLLPTSARSVIRNEALRSGQSGVRQEAIRQIAATDWLRARTLGMRDANERVRRWASDISEPVLKPSAVAEMPVGEVTNLKAKKSALAQSSLFD